MTSRRAADGVVRVAKEDPKLLPLVDAVRRVLISLSPFDLRPSFEQRRPSLLRRRWRMGRQYSTLGAAAVPIAPAMADGTSVLYPRPAYSASDFLVSVR